MTIPIWMVWLVPVAVLIVGGILAVRHGRMRGDYDFVSPVVGCAAFLVAVIAALLVVIAILVFGRGSHGS